MTPLSDSWRLQSSRLANAGGEQISRRGFDATGWYPAKVPATVLGALVEHGVYPDPFSGMNFLRIPGQGPRHENFSLHPMPADSPFAVPWWFRREFGAVEEGSAAWLEFFGVNYRANVWVNGTRVAKASEVAGAYRTYEFLVSDLTRSGQPNVVALEVFPPTPGDLAVTWVDWNPSPPDKNMGLWQDVILRRSGPVALRSPQVVIAFEEDGRVALTVCVTLVNATDRPQSVLVHGDVDGVAVRGVWDLAPRERREVIVGGAGGPSLPVRTPRLWWPRGLGPQPLYELRLAADVAGNGSDALRRAFGIRRVTSELTDRGHALFRVNGHPVLIRGGGWAKDLFQRRNAERDLYEYEYVKDLGLNTIRFEGMLERGDFLDRCDRDGVLVIAGWCCCDQWERWDDWSEEDRDIAAESLRSQIRRVRHHPSLIAWWYGSDNPPPYAVEQRYLDVLRDERWPNPSHSSASQKPAELTGASGMKMLGPYDYVPPVYWYADRERGGAFGFATEISPGPAIPPTESLRSMLTDAHLWPPDEAWTLHCGGGVFKDLTLFNDALGRRYGPWADVEEYAMKAQLSAYESQRAMFEAYTRNRYESTGVIQWMLNNAWPSLIWHLWDWYLRPGGGYYGVKKACEPLHVQYSYDDETVVLVNMTREAVPDLDVRARVLDVGGTELFRDRVACTAPPDSTQRLFAVPAVPGRSALRFLQLDLRDAGGTARSRNLYWLSTVTDAVDYDRGTWFHSPISRFADLTGLGELPAAAIEVEASQHRGAEDRRVVTVAMRNPGAALAFFLRLQLLGADGLTEVLPVCWDDNFVSVPPGESLSVRGSFRSAVDGTLVVRVSGWNVNRLEARC